MKITFSDDAVRDAADVSEALKDMFERMVGYTFIVSDGVGSPYEARLDTVWVAMASEKSVLLGFSSDEGPESVLLSGKNGFGEDLSLEYL